MRITPLRGLSINNVHAPAGVPVDVDDRLGAELIGYGVAVRAPDVPAATKPAPEEKPSPVIETAEAAPAPENAAVKHRRRR